MRTILSAVLSLSLICPTSFAKVQQTDNINRVFGKFKTSHRMYDAFAETTHHKMDREFFLLLKKKTKNVLLPKSIGKANEIYFEGMKKPVKIHKDGSYSYFGMKWKPNYEENVTTNVLSMMNTWAVVEDEKSAFFSLFPKAYAKTNDKEDYNWTRSLDKGSYDLGEKALRSARTPEGRESVELLRKFPEFVFKMLAAFGLVLVGQVVKKAPTPWSKVAGWGLTLAGGFAAWGLTSSFAEGAEIDGHLQEMSCPKGKNPIQIQGSTPSGKPLNVDVNLDENGRPANLIIKNSDGELSRCYLTGHHTLNNWKATGCKGSKLSDDVMNSLLNAAYGIKAACKISTKTIKKSNKKLAEINREVLKERRKTKRTRGNQ